VSSAIRFVAWESNATKRPLPLISGPNDAPPRIPNPSLWLSDWTPALLTLMRSVTPVSRSCTKMSRLSFVSPATRLVANELKATKRPSPLMLGLKLDSSACAPPVATLTRRVVRGC